MTATLKPRWRPWVWSPVWCRSRSAAGDVSPSGSPKAVRATSTCITSDAVGATAGPKGLSHSKKAPGPGGFFFRPDRSSGGGALEGQIVPFQRVSSGGQAFFQLGLGVDQGLRQVVGQLLEVRLVQLEFVNPGGFVDAGHGLELFGAEVQAGPVDFFVCLCCS